MNYLDILICLPIAYGAWVGLRKGLIIEVCTLLALLLGIWGGIKFSDATAEFLSTNMGMTTEYLPAIAFTVTFLIVGAMVFFAGKAIEQVVNLAQMKPLNKAFGLVFGSLKYVFFISIALVILESYDERSEFIPEKMKEGSLLFSPVKDVSLETIPALRYSDLFIKAGKMTNEQEEEPTANLESP